LAPQALVLIDDLTFGGLVLVELLDDLVYLDKLEKVIGYHFPASCRPPIWSMSTIGWRRPFTKFRCGPHPGLLSAPLVERCRELTVGVDRGLLLSENESGIRLKIWTSKGASVNVICRHWENIAQKRIRMQFFRQCVMLNNIDIAKAAKIFNVSHVTLYCLIDKYNLRFMSIQGKSFQDLE